MGEVGQRTPKKQKRQANKYQTLKGGAFPPELYDVISAFKAPDNKPLMAALAQSTVNIFGPAVRLSFLLNAFSSLIPSQSCCSTRFLPSSCFPIIAGKYRPYADTKAVHSSEASSVPDPPISYPYSVLGFYLNINWIEPSFNSIKICFKG